MANKIYINNTYIIVNLFEDIANIKAGLSTEHFDKYNNNIELDKKIKYIWEYTEYYNERDDKLWQEYIQNHPEHFEELPQLKQENIWEYLDEIRKNEK